MRRAREALDRAAQEFLATSSEISEAGYALVASEALASAPQEIALRALAQLIGAVGGGETPLQLAKIEALLAALQAHPGKAHTLGRCRLEPYAGRLGIFREMRGKGLPVARLLPGAGAVGQPVQDRARRDESKPILVKALGESGWRALRDRSALASSLPRLAGGLCPPAGAAMAVGATLARARGRGREPGVDCRAALRQLWRQKNGGTGNLT